MSRPHYSVGTRLFFGAVIAGGAGSAIWMLQQRWMVASLDLQTLAAFGGLGLLWSLLTFFGQGKIGGRPAVALAPAAFEALLPVRSSPLVLIAALITLIGDWLAHRRRPLTALFNAGQTLISCLFGWGVAQWWRGENDGLLAIGGAAIAGAAAFSAGNLILVAVALQLIGKRRGEGPLIGFAAILNELIVGSFAALMAVAWSLHPAALLVPVLPLTLVFLLLARLERREEDLRRRQEQLQSIQELGLEISARLDGSELGPAVTRLVAGQLEAAGATLFLIDEQQQEQLLSVAHTEFYSGSRPPRSVFRGPLCARLWQQPEPLLLNGDELAEQAELRWLRATSALVQPIRLIGKMSGLLVVYRTESRLPFGAEDLEQVAAVARFVEVALANARLHEDLLKMQQQLVQTEKMSALGQLVSGVAHELNNPLGTISGTAELCASEELAPRPRQLLGRIQKESARAARIVRHLLTFARHHKPEIGWHRLQDLIRDVAELREEECSRRGITLRVEVDPDLPAARIDPHQIHQVLLNLVTNAEQAIASASGKGEIVISVQRDGARLRIEVADSGPGISEENMPKIFNPFFTTKPVGQGTGLGLSICFGIVQEHGGTIKVRSTPGSGAVFAIELPAPTGAERDAPTQPIELELASALQRATSRELRLLVVDDEEGIRSVICDALTAWGHECTPAASGEEGLRLLRERQFDLAIVDFRMPGLDGAEMVSRAQQEKLPLPALIFSTGETASDELRRCLDLPRTQLLQKPFSLLTLRETVESAVSGAAPTALASSAS